MHSFVTGRMWLNSVSVDLLLVLFLSFVSLPVKSYFNRIGTLTTALPILSVRATFKQYTFEKGVCISGSKYSNCSSLHYTVHVKGPGEGEGMWEGKRGVCTYNCTWKKKTLNERGRNLTSETTYGQKQFKNLPLMRVMILNMFKQFQIVLMCFLAKTFKYK